MQEVSFATFNPWTAASTPRGCGSSGSAVALAGQMCPARWVRRWWAVAAGVVVVSDTFIVPSVNGGHKVGQVGGLMVGLR